MPRNVSIVLTVDGAGTALKMYYKERYPYYSSKLEDP
jgi:hypothetical protein